MMRKSILKAVFPFLLACLFSFSLPLLSQETDSVSAPESVQLEFLYTQVLKVFETDDVIPPGCKAEWIGSKRYIIEEVVVHSKAELLQKMGITEESALGRGRTALVEAFEHGQSEAMKNRLDLAAKVNAMGIQDGKIGVRLYDTTLLQDVPAEVLEKDFWPRASIPITLSSAYGQTVSTVKAQSVLSHEVSHILDNTQNNGAGSYPYGLDGAHWSIERTNPITAFCEGWAIYNEYLDFPERFSAGPPNDIMIESSEMAGQYSYVPTASSTVTAEDLMSTEVVAARFMYQIATSLPDGKKKVSDIFTKTNAYGVRSFSTFVYEFIEAFPEDSAAILQILDELTLYKYTGEELYSTYPFPTVKQYVGSRPGSLPPHTDTLTGIASDSWTNTWEQTDTQATVGSNSWDTSTWTSTYAEPGWTDSGVASGSWSWESEPATWTPPSTYEEPAIASFPESGIASDGTSQTGFFEQFGTP